MKMIGATVLVVLFTLGCNSSSASATDYTVVDTGQEKCYDNMEEIAFPLPGDPFYGQDAQYFGNQPSFTVSADGLTVYDNVTGLTWMQSPDTNLDGTITYADKLTWTQAQTVPTTLNAANYGGYSDWRLPSIKELYSLIDHSGIDLNPEASTGTTPFIDTDVFGFAYGFISEGERIIDSQWVTTTLYVANTNQMFGVNFADGRIKGYPTSDAIGKKYHVLCVRGDTSYGVNQFADNSDGTVTDNATGLIWMQDDSGTGYDWEDALDYAENLSFAGYDDWRLPNAKELQSIVDYTRSPNTTGSAAIDPIFTCTQITNEAGQADYGFYWTSTTHVGESPEGSIDGNDANYVAFGRALGYMHGTWTDVHGAGCQRSDPKEGDPADYPYGRGPQGDAVRIYNYVRCVRGGVTPYHVHLRKGNVNTGISDPEEVFFVNGSAGDENRKITVLYGTNIVATMVRPSAGPNPARYTLYFWDREAGEADLTEEPYDLGISCFPFPLANGTPAPPPNNSGK